MERPQNIAPTMTQPDEQPYHDLAVHFLGIAAPPDWLLKGLKLQTKEFERHTKEKEHCTQHGPSSASSGTHPHLREFLRKRNGQEPLPTSECSCVSCAEYEDFIKAVKLSLSDEMAQKKEISRINAIAQDVMVNNMAGGGVGNDNGRDKEVREMVIAVMECRVRRSMA